MKKVVFVAMDTYSIYLTIHCFFFLLWWWWFSVYVCAVYFTYVYAAMWRWGCKRQKSIPLACTEFQIGFHCKCDLDCYVANYSYTLKIFPMPEKKTSQASYSKSTVSLSPSQALLPLLAWKVIIEILDRKSLVSIFLSQELKSTQIHNTHSHATHKFIQHIHKLIWLC